jgi:hypothetical protein
MWATNMLSAPPILKTLIVAISTMAEYHLNELRNKSEAEIFALLDKKTDELSKTFADKYVLEDRIG